MRFGRIAVMGLVLLGSVHAVALPAAAEDAAPGACAALDQEAVQTVLDAVHGPVLDAAKIGSVLEENVVYNSPMWGVVTGQDAVVAAYEDLASSISDLSLEPEEVLVDAPYLVVRYGISGMHTGDFEGMAGTGKKVESSGITIYRMHCGMVSEAWVHFDFLGMMAQMDDDYAAFMPAEPVPTRVMADSCPDPTSEDMETLVRQMYTEAWTRTPDLAAVLEPDVVLHSALGPDIVGIDAVEPLRSNYFVAFPDLEYRHGEIISDGDLAATWWTATGTDTGGFLGLEPTGKMMVLDGITIYRAHCGKIGEIWTESDLYDVRRQLGGS
ncbi:MAG: ester cyclase [Thermomicrobiales bacterium]